VSERFALRRWGHRPSAGSSCLYHLRHERHTVRSQLECGGTCRVKKGAVISHSLHATCHDHIFDTEVRGVGRCRGRGLKYAGGASAVKDIKHGSEIEFLIFDHVLETNGTYPRGARTVGEEVSVEVYERELDKRGQWEKIVDFDLTVEVEI